MAEAYVIRVIEAGWEEEVTTATVGPFTDAAGIATTLEAAGYRRSDPTEDARTAYWGRAIEILPLTKEMPPAG